MHLLTGILAKLVQRGIQDKGGVVTTSILAGTLGLTTMTHGLLAGGKWALDRQSNLLDGGAPFYSVYKTKDEKFIALGALEPVFYKEILQVLNLQNTLSIDQQYDTSGWPEMRRLFAEAFTQRDRDEWAVLATRSDCCLTPVLNFEESMALHQNRVNGWILDEPSSHPGLVIQF